MAKYYMLREYLANASWARSCEFLVPAAVTAEQLQCVHDSSYVQRVINGELTQLEQRRIGFPWSPQLVERSRRSVGGTLAAARAALQEGIAVHLAGGTHHASADSGQGFCVFNDTAVAARVLQREGRLQRVVIVDCDVHQGNGTASIFANDPTVYTFSMHAASNFPFGKHDADMDVSLPDGTADVEYIDRLDRSLDTALKQARADFAFYIAGADPFAGDRLGKLKLTKAGLMARDRLVITRCRAWALPVAVVMGGGYAPRIEDIVEIHANTVAAACERFDHRAEAGPVKTRFQD